MENAAVAEAENGPRELCHAMPASYACLLMQISGKRVTSEPTVGRQPPSPLVALGHAAVLFTVDS